MVEGAAQGRRRAAATERKRDRKGQ